MLSVENVSFNYNDSATVDAVSFSVKKGGVMAVVGESGSGKSTLLKLIYGHLDVCLGSISWKDQPILGPKNKLVAVPIYELYLFLLHDNWPLSNIQWIFNSKPNAEQYQFVSTQKRLYDDHGCQQRRNWKESSIHCF